MKIAIENTAEIVGVLAPNGGTAAVPCRVWQGRTEGGIPVRLLVALVAVNDDQDQAPFERELEEKQPRADELRVFPARLVL